jgi:hypothetical protein
MVKGGNNKISAGRTGTRLVTYLRASFLKHSKPWRLGNGKKLSLKATVYLLPMIRKKDPFVKLPL